MVGSNRVINAHKIVNPVGNSDLDPKAEKDFRRSIVEKALEALQADIKGQKLFMRIT